MELITLVSVCYELNESIPSDLSELDTNKLKKECNDSAFLSKFQETLDYFYSSKWDKCYVYSKVLLDIAWEHLNTGHWKDVDIHWRYAYTLLCTFKAVCEFVQYKTTYDRKNLACAIKTCDMGLLMGAPVNDNILAKLVAEFQRIYAKRRQVMSSYEDMVCMTNKKMNTQKLPAINLSNAIKRVRCPSLEYFKNSHMDKEEPVILEGAIDYWPAFGERKWSLQYIKDVAGCRTVPIELGSKYTDDAWSQKLLTLEEFIEKYIENKEKKYTRGIPGSTPVI